MILAQGDLADLTLLVANSLCRVRGRGMICETLVQIGNSD